MQLAWGRPIALAGLQVLLLIAGMVACYRGLIISGGGAKAVGTAVNGPRFKVFAFLCVVVVSILAIAPCVVRGVTIQGRQRRLSGSSMNSSVNDEQRPSGSNSSR